MTRWQAFWKLRCPHCLQGEVFSGLLKMHERCPVCAIQYEREHGFFLVSIFFGYVLGFIALLPILIALYLLAAPLYWYLIISTVILSLLAPLIFRYSRVLWLHLDEMMDPRGG